MFEQRLKISKCRVLKVTNNQYDDVIHGMNNPGRELIRKSTDLVFFSFEILFCIEADYTKKTTVRKKRREEKEKVTKLYLQIRIFPANSSVDLEIVSC